MSDRAILISQASFLSDAPGGVQWCTREYQATLEAAGFSLETLSFTPSSQWFHRLRRRLSPRRFAYVPVAAVLSRLASLLERWPAAERRRPILLLNNADALSLAPALRRAYPTARLISLSHGPEVVDEVIPLALGTQRLGPWPALRLGTLFATECAARRCIDGVVCIAAEDLQIERWLGAPEALFLPRMIPDRELTPSPVAARIGVVATLDHAPNHDGLVRLAEAISACAEPLSLRVVGSGAALGKALARRFACIHYCGRLSDAELEREAASWLAFANPVFCQARGASTKVATALMWGLPVFSSVQGIRGYRWDRQALPVAGTAAELAALLAAVTPATAEDWRRRARLVRALAPSLAESGAQLRRFIRADQPGCAATPEAADGEALATKRP